MADNETIADIIAEIRALSNPISDGIIAINGRSIADRIEAAHKRAAAFHAMTCEANDRLREHLRIALDANGREHGDAAKLREAVIETQSVIAKCMDVLNRIPDSCGYGGLVDDVADELCDLRERYVMPALAAPPRNCDVIGNTGRALVVHGFPTKSNQWGEGEWLEFVDWLFAPATEKEGGNDADK